jgi:quinone-modifying oxidoreductase subunit QmoC
MAEPILLEPDVGFINDVAKLGGEDVKKCYQCATCSVACPISPDANPFPRKEMIATGWGLKDKVVNNADIWLCHNCGDCTTLCPRGAKPGDVLAALRVYAISEYVPGPLKKVAKAVNDPKKLPLLLLLPTIIFIAAYFISQMIWPHEGGAIWQGHFINNYIVDIIMIPTFFTAAAVFALGLKKFVEEMHANALAGGQTDQAKPDPVAIVKGLVKVIPTILSHRKFNECTENKERATSHMMVLFGFIGLFIVTNCFFFAEWILHIEGPYSQLNPVKWLGNAAGIALVIGAVLLIKSRLNDTDSKASYADWYLLGLALALGLTGMLTQMTRLAGMETATYAIYFVHLVAIWCLFAYTPFTKLAHLVYRTTAMAYNESIGRK